jgi:spermidine/putrescine transport system permease protein
VAASANDSRQSKRSPRFGCESIKVYDKLSFSISMTDSGVVMERRLAWLPTFWLVIFLGLPLVLIAVQSFSPITYTGRMLWWPPTMEHYEAVFTPINLGILKRTVWYALLTTAITFALSFPMAIFFNLISPRARLIGILLVSLPFFTNFLVRIYAWYILLRPDGLVGRLARLIDESTILLNSSFAVVVGLTYVYLPFMLLPITNAMEKIDRNQLDAARDLGARWWQVVGKILLPLSRKGIVAGSILVMIPCLGEMLIQRILGMTPMLGNLIEDSFLGKTRPNWPRGSALAIVLMIMVMILLSLMRRFEGKSHQKY